MNVHIAVSHEYSMPSGRQAVVAQTATIALGQEQDPEKLPDITRVAKDLMRNVNDRLAWELTLDKMNVPYPRTDDE